MKINKVSKCDPELINEISARYNAYKICLLLYLNGMRTEDEAYGLYVKFSDLFSSVAHSLGIRNPSADFDSQIVYGDPLAEGDYLDMTESDLVRLREANNRANFYRECVRKSTGTSDISGFIDNIGKHIQVIDQFTMSFDHPVSELDFVGKRVYL